eukprot:786859-Pleurochrysis_carterae.AAC.1
MEMLISILVIQYNAKQARIATFIYPMQVVRSAVWRHCSLVGKMLNNIRGRAIDAELPRSRGSVCD